MAFTDSHCIALWKSEEYPMADVIHDHVLFYQDFTKVVYSQTTALIGYICSQVIIDR